MAANSISSWPTNAQYTQCENSELFQWKYKRCTFKSEGNRTQVNCCWSRFHSFARFRVFALSPARCSQGTPSIFCTIPVPHLCVLSVSNGIPYFLPFAISASLSWFISRQHVYTHSSWGPFMLLFHLVYQLHPSSIWTLQTTLRHAGTDNGTLCFFYTAYFI